MNLQTPIQPLVRFVNFMISRFYRVKCQFLRKYSQWTVALSNKEISMSIKQTLPSKNIGGQIA